MDVALHTPGAMTQANFLEWECHAAGWYDYDRRRPVAMTGGSPRHARTVVRLISAVLNALDLDRFDMLTGAGVGVPRRRSAVSGWNGRASRHDRGRLRGRPSCSRFSSPPTVALDRSIRSFEYRLVPSIMQVDPPWARTGR